MIETIEFKGESYPLFQSQGFASQFSFPFAKQVCKGIGYDIGCNRDEWGLPGAIKIDIAFKDGYDALNLPSGLVSYIYSSHMAEHLVNWVKAIDYWHSKLEQSGVLFLYLPNMDAQHYWKPWNNRKHVHYFNPILFKKYFEDNRDKWCNVFVTEGYDLNYSFYAIAEKYESSCSINNV